MKNTEHKVFIKRLDNGDILRTYISDRIGVIQTLKDSKGYVRQIYINKRPIISIMKGN